MSDFSRDFKDRLDIRKQIARIDRMRDERDKLRAEQDKLRFEGRNSSASARRWR